MRIQDEEILKRLDSLFPIRARLVSIHSGDKGRFELTDHQGSEVEIDGVSPLRIISVLRSHNYPEVFEEIAAFDGEIVFSKPAVPPAKTRKSPPHPLDDHPTVLNFF
jgi:hypothetical protein